MSSGQSELLASLLAEEAFTPAEPRTFEEVGLDPTFVESLILKTLAVTGTASGREVADRLSLPFGSLDVRLNRLRTRQRISHVGSAPLNDYMYSLTELGREESVALAEACAYVGAAPVPLPDYVNSVDAQTITAESPQREQLEKAFADISVPQDLFDRIGPAINSGAGLFLYGAPGNGKTTLAERITLCFGQDIWIPKTVIADGQIIKLYDPEYHVEVRSDESSILKTHQFDRRWVKVQRPTVVAGGELTMDNLEIRHDPHTQISEAPLQMKSNCGTLLIDDFGRQRMNPLELLNRWIVPLEKRYDFLTLSTGKKIQIPFDQLIIFSTNLEPKDLVDEAFLRRIPYKINISDPNEEEFFDLFKSVCKTVNCEFDRTTVEHLLENHYRKNERGLRRCHPRDLMYQIRHYCSYHGEKVEMTPEHFDRVVENYFTIVGDMDA